MPAESILEKRIKRYAESKGCLFWKFVSPGVKGVPDRLIVTPKGNTFFLEIKASGKKPKAFQEYQMKRLREHKVCAGYVDNYEIAVGVIDSLCSPKL
jgi:hypothetical protein